MSFLPVKSDGRTVMTCDFATILDGILRFSDEAWERAKKDPAIVAQIEQLGEERARRAGAVLDVTNDGYYTNEKCIPDFLKVCVIVIVLFLTKDVCNLFSKVFFLINIPKIFIS